MSAKDIALLGLFLFYIFLIVDNFKGFGREASFMFKGLIWLAITVVSIAVIFGRK